jgi:tetratricopeptide (TPR) repeat protein
LGRFELALDDFKRATALLAKMDSNYTLVEAHLQWGYAYHCERKEWSAAAAHFTKVYELIVTTREAYVEERIRLLIGMARVALNAGTPNGLATTFSLLKRANQDLQTNKMVWWQPAVAYYWGLAFLKKGDVVAANMKFDEAVRAVAENGNPDYLPLVLLEMGKLETVGLKRRQMLRQCYEAAKQRSRFTDKQACLQAIAQIDPSILR